MIVQLFAACCIREIEIHCTIEIYISLELDEPDIYKLFFSQIQRTE